MDDDFSLNTELNEFAEKMIPRVKTAVFEGIKSIPEGGRYFISCPIVVGVVRPTDMLAANGQPVYELQLGSALIALDNAMHHISLNPRIKLNVWRAIHELLTRNDDFPDGVELDNGLMSKLAHEQNLRLNASRERDELRKEFDLFKEAELNKQKQKDAETQRLLELVNEKTKEAEHFIKLYSELKSRR